MLFAHSICFSNHPVISWRLLSRYLFLSTHHYQPPAVMSHQSIRVKKFYFILKLNSQTSRGGLYLVKEEVGGILYFWVAIIVRFNHAFILKSRITKKVKQTLCTYSGGLQTPCVCTLTLHNRWKLQVKSCVLLDWKGTTSSSNYSS